MKIFQKFLGVSSIFCLTIALASPLVALAAGPAAVNLGSAGNFVILAKTGISATGVTSIVGDLGVSPAAASYITGFGLTMDVSNVFSTSAKVTGKIYASDYTPPAPTNMTTAISDMQTAYTSAVGLTNPTATELGAGSIGGMVLSPGLYKWGTGVNISSDLTLNGSADDVWIFQIAQTLTVSSAARINLTGGAQASNIFWVVAGQTTLGTTAVFNGNILDQTAIVLNTGVKLNGRALAQSAVTLDASLVTAPVTTAAAPTPAPTPAATSTPAPAPTPTPAPAPTPTYVPEPVIAPASGGGVNFNSTVAPAANLSVNPVVSLNRPLAVDFGQQVRTIALNLGVGSRNNNVKILQQFLIAQNKGPSVRALGKIKVLGYFGGLTRSALAEWQAKVGIKPASGNFGVKTRAYINAHF